MEDRGAGEGNMAKKPRNVAPVTAGAAPAAAPKKPLIIFVHGIRDPGFWQQRLRQIFADKGYVAVPIGFGVLDIFRFLFGLRRKSVEVVKQQIKDAIDNNPGSDVTIIAHSFGTYAVTRIMDEDPTLDVSKLIMCGAIVRRGYRWDKAVRLNGQNNGKMLVVNEHSARDIWPLFARHATFGFGDTGSIGCQDSNVTDRRHNTRHSEYLTEAFANTYWVPFLTEGKKLAEEAVPEKMPWYFALTRTPATMAQVAVLGIGAFAASWAWDRVNFQTKGAFTHDASSLDSPIEIRGFARLDSESSEPIYSFNESADGSNRKILSVGNFDKLSVKIGKTLANDCGQGSRGEDAAPSGAGQGLLTRNESTWITYTFDLHRAHLWFGKAQIDLRYVQQRLPQAADFKAEISEAQKESFGTHGIDQLRLEAGEGLDASRIQLISVKHNGAVCLDDMFNPEAFVSIKPSKSAKVANSWFSLSAWAQDGASALSGDEIRTMVQSKDGAVRSIGIRTVIANPARYGKDVGALVNDAATDNETLVALITAARAKEKSAIALDTERIITLTYADNADLRDAARAYLRAPGVVSEGVASLISKRVDTEIAGLRTQKAVDRDYNKDYLLLIAARDVYYNLGVVNLDKFLGSASSSAAQLAAAVDLFESGRALMSKASNPREKAAMAKNTYGKAMAQLRGAMWSEAVQQKDPYGYLAQAIAAQQPVNSPAAKETFDVFLQEIAASHDTYPWPLHIAQAETCLKSLTFACFGGGVSAQ
jgi:pimeloyl-ACP methyl ester carboxylesterase